MLSTISKRLRPTPSMAIAFVALVFAVTGGAFAAIGDHGSSGGARGLNGAVAKAKAKAKAGPRGPAGPAGKNGANGATGPTGPAGSTGPAGATGPTGATGTNGTNGEKGTNGTTGTPGKEGEKGKEGSPWTAGGTLPKGSEEKGVWTDFGSKEGEIRREAISFEIPLKTDPEVEFVTGTPTANCPGSTESPTAQEGYLCVYDSLPAEFVSVKASFLSTALFGSADPAGVTGTQATWTTEFSTAFKETGETGAYDKGTWAVAGD